MGEQTDRSTWYLAQLKPNSHKIAARNLARQGFGTFHPMAEDTRRQNGRFVTTKRPFFPGYIFVAFDAQSGVWRAINSTHGVTRLVSFANTPAPVPQPIMEALFGRFDEDGTALAPETFVPGDCVSITEGPFADYIAQVDAMAPDQRVWVLLDIMGRQTRVAVPAQGLRRA